MEFEKVTKVDLGLIKKVKQTEGSVLLFFTLEKKGLRICYIGLAPITQYTHVCIKNSNTQGSSTNVVKVIFDTTRNCS